MNKKKLQAELFWIMAAQAITFIGGFGIVKLLAIALGTENYGYYSLCLSLSAIISLLWYGPIDQIILRYWCNPITEQEKIKKIIATGHLIGLILSLLICSTIYILNTIIKEEVYINLLSMALFLSVSKGFLSSTFSIKNAERNRRSIFLIQLLEILIRLTGTILAFNSLTIGLVITTAIISSALPAAIFTFAKDYNIKSFRNKIENIRKYKLNIEDLKSHKKYFSYGKSFILIGIFASICNYFDRWIIQFTMSASDVGIYSAISQIATAPLIALTTATTQFLNPILIKNEPSNNLKWKKIYIILSVLYGSITLIFYIFSKEIVILLLTPDFAQHHKILPSVSFGLSFFYFAQVYFIKAQKAEKPQIIQIAWIFRSIIMVTLSSLLVNIIGIWGIATSIIFSSIAFLIILIIQSNQLREA